MQKVCSISFVESASVFEGQTLREHLLFRGAALPTQLRSLFHMSYSIHPAFLCLVSQPMWEGLR
ncbi:hypothetical protein D3C73_1606250 [compost metagenome]